MADAQRALETNRPQSSGSVSHYMAKGPHIAPPA